jgi:acetoin:2,6-dichlorophenolindophenol oxidoreductase subunit alpha
VWAVREAARRAADPARAGGGPAFLETLTYRFVGHSRSDPGAYRKPGELDEMRKRDPLVVARERLTGAGVDSAQIDAADARVAERMAEVVQAALAAPFPVPDAPASEYKDSAAL